MAALNTDEVEQSSSVEIDDFIVEEGSSLSVSTQKTSLEIKIDDFHDKIRRIETLQEKLDTHAVAVRRRICSVLDHESDVRSSHLRLFLTHSYASEVTQAAAVAALMKQPATPGQTAEAPCARPSPPIWTLHIEGKLLIDHLDHAAIQAYDKKTGYTPPKDDLDRSRGEEEEIAELKPVQFTGLFDKVVVSFQTVYEPEQQKKKSSKKKTTRRTSGSPNPKLGDPQEDAAEPAFTVSEQHRVEWKNGDTPEADMFSFKYVEKPTNTTPPPGKVHSIIARVEVYRRHQYPTATRPIPGNVKYRILSSELQQLLFPHHGPETTDLLTGHKRKFGQDDDEGVAELPPPAHNGIHIPAYLTMGEIVNAFFTYIYDRKIVKGDVVSADKTLQTLLDMEQFSFSQLQQLLKSRNLIEAVVVDHDPVRITYILEQESASVLGKPHAEDEDPSILQLDMDISVPSLFPHRARELLRRIKRRELEYTSSRTKARYLFQTNAVTRVDDGRVVRNQIEKAVNDKSHLSADLIPVHLALAKAAPPQSEARMAAHLDARLAFLSNQLKEKIPAAKRAWEVADACRDLVDENGN